jgi:selenocysteine lyase/cysteine desulfurase
VTPESSSLSRVTSYDEFSRSPSAVFTNTNVIAGLKASFNLMERIGYDRIRQRSRALKGRFLREIDTASFNFIGGSPKDDTMILCLEPISDWTYNYPQIKSFLESQSVFVETPPITSRRNIPIRVTFPYFAGVTQVENAAQILNNIVR